MPIKTHFDIIIHHYNLNKYFINCVFLNLLVRLNKFSKKSMKCATVQILNL